MIESKANAVVNTLKRRSKFYKEKLKHFNLWASKKSEMNGASRGAIQANLKQMLKEIGVPNDKIVLVLSGLYANLHEFEASSIINKIYTNYKGNPKIVDIFNKDPSIIKESINAMLISIVETDRLKHLVGDMLLTGTCVFLHFILQGGRGGIDGFGGSEDLISIEKKRYLALLNNKEKLAARMIAKDVGKETIRRLSYYNKNTNLEEDEAEDVPEDWETLCE